MLFTLVGCAAVEETSRRPMVTGVYKVSNQVKDFYYTSVEENDITLYPATKTKAGWIADTSASSSIQINTSKTDNRERLKFSRSTFDLDVMTILFKYRPIMSGFPRQLNTNFNAAEFVGLRTDNYKLSYDKTPLNTYQPRINHFAYSIGGFVGLGATTMNPSVTNNYLQLEYDGVVITKGVAGLIGVGDFTFGATIGFDNLLDKNRKNWIYENKPWLGFAVGFNIN